MASWLAEPFFLLSLSVAAAAPVKNHTFAIKPQKSHSCWQDRVQYFLNFLSFATKKSFLPFLLFQDFVISLHFLVPSGFLWLSYVLCF